MSLAGSQMTLFSSRATARGSFANFLEKRETLLDSIEETTGLEGKVEAFRTARDAVKAQLKQTAGTNRANNALLRAL